MNIIIDIRDVIANKYLYEIRIEILMKLYLQYFPSRQTFLFKFSTLLVKNFYFKQPKTISKQTQHNIKLKYFKQFLY